MPTCACGFAHSPESATHCKLCGLPLTGGTSKEARPAAGGAPAVGDRREHKLVAEGAAAVLLEPGKTLTIGREEGVGLAIPSQRVSRRHAEIVWRAGLPVLRNLSQSAGTLVNGQAIGEHELRDGDKLKIGPYECTYTVRGVGAAPKPAAPAAMGATLVDSGGEAMSGNLGQMSAFALLRMFEAREQTGTLTLRTANKEGHLVLENGRITRAEADGKRGKPALFLLLSWREGTYSFSLETKVPGQGKILRSFSYHAVPEGPEFPRRTTISDLLEEAEAQGIDEFGPAPGPDAPAPADPAPTARGAAKPPASGRSTGPAGARRPPPRAQ